MKCETCGDTRCGVSGSAFCLQVQRDCWRARAEALEKENHAMWSVLSAITENYPEPANRAAIAEGWLMIKRIDDARGTT